MKARQPLKLVVLFAIVVFSIISMSNTLLGVITVVLFNHGTLPEVERNPVYPIIMSLIVSIIIGTIISIIIGKFFLSPILKLSKAMMDVSKGNFNVRVNKNENNAKEIGEMINNFNIMVMELGNIETFRSDFIANVSHEFKTPLSAIEGYTSLLQDENLTNEEKNVYIKRIFTSTRRLSTLSENILKISKLENQEIGLNKKNYRLDEQIRQAILLLEPKWNEKNIELIINLKPVIFFGNEEVIMQIWVNLIENAVKFSKNNGIIKVYLKCVDDLIKVYIEDNGVGMNEEVIQHIFEKFYQGDKSRTGDGNGLGLPLVKKIVELYGGWIEVKSETEKGSRFTVVLSTKG